MSYWKQPTMLELPFGKSERFLTAGSFKNFPGVPFYGIKLAPEVSNAAHLIVPIKDFGLPNEMDIYSALRVALYQVALGRKVYVGCMGGYGRTGTFLALLFRVLGVPDPIDYVRAVYDDRAVETDAQEHFVRTLFTGPVRYDVLRARYTALMVDTYRQEKGKGFALSQGGQAAALAAALAKARGQVDFTLGGRDNRIDFPIGN